MMLIFSIQKIKLHVIQTLQFLLLVAFCVSTAFLSIFYVNLSRKVGIGIRICLGVSVIGFKGSQQFFLLVSTYTLIIARRGYSTCFDAWNFSELSPRIFNGNYI